MKLKKIIASLSAAIIASATFAMTATAATGTVQGITVNYSSTVTANYALSTSSLQANPAEYDITASIDATYVYRNTSTGVSETDYEFTGWTVGGNGLQYTAPTGYEMKSVAATHFFRVNGVQKAFYSAASR